MTFPTHAARVTGLAYLALALAGTAAHLVIRPRLHVPGDPTATAATLVEHALLARVGIAADLTVVLAQAVAAVGFLALLAPLHRVAAAAVAAFGLVNATLVLVATGFSATALQTALGGGDDDAARLLLDLSAATWQLGGLFFGLWLVPMGWAVMRARSAPRALGALLVVGGLGYVAGTYATYLAPGVPAAGVALSLLATVGELWMIGFLLRVGLRRAPTGPRQASSATPVPSGRSARRV